MSNQIISSDSTHIQVGNNKYSMKGKHPYNNSGTGVRWKVWVGCLADFYFLFRYYIFSKEKHELTAVFTRDRWAIQSWKLLFSTHFPAPYPENHPSPSSKYLYFRRVQRYPCLYQGSQKY